MTERPGRLQLVAASGARPAPSAGVPEVPTVGHGGLIDLAVDPGYAANGTIYFSYLVGRENASMIRVMKAKLDERNETLTGQQVLFESTAGPRPSRLADASRSPLTAISFSPSATGGAAIRHRTFPMTRGRSSASAPTARSPRAIPSDGASVHGPRSGAMAIAIRKVSPSMRSVASYGPTSMARREATSSISFFPAAITAGR